MRLQDFLRLPRLEDKDNFSEKLKENDRFLYGWRMKQQIKTKKAGHEISYFRALKVVNNNVEYVTEFDILEKDKE